MELENALIGIAIAGYLAQAKAYLSRWPDVKNVNIEILNMARSDAWECRNWQLGAMGGKTERAVWVWLYDAWSRACKEAQFDSDW